MVFANMKLILKAVPPFDFDLSAQIFSNGDKRIRSYEDGKFWQVIKTDGKLILIVVKSLGSVDDPKLSVTLRSNEEVSGREKARVKEIIFWLLDLNYDLKPFYGYAINDRVMARLTQELRGLKSPATVTVFEALFDSIVEQQISLHVAHGLETNVIKSFGNKLKLGNEVYYTYPTPQNLASATVAELRKCGLSQRKAEYIQNVSRLIVEGGLDLERLKDCKDTDAIVNTLDRIRGVGIWTTELTMVRGMRKNALPADDLGLRRVISHYYCDDKRITSREARIIAEKWGIWKGLAAFYLIMGERIGIEP
jgi:DNA-3-methyladenine glycosylase II